MSDETDDLTLLTAFERENLQGRYKQHLLNQRHNWRANFYNFRPLWDCLMLIDEIWSRELEGMSEGVMKELNEAYAVLLFVAAHAKVRVALDLFFSDFIMEAYSIMREVIEFVVHGCRLLSRPDLMGVWLNRDKDAASLQRWKEEFWFGKENRLFEGLPELYVAWKLCSENASHAHSGVLHQRIYGPGSEKGQVPVNYSGVHPQILAVVLFGMLQMLENLEFRMFERAGPLLRLDTELQQLRDKFKTDKDATMVLMKLDVELATYDAKIKSSEPSSE
jgi:hypothetical protein